MCRVFDSVHINIMPSDDWQVCFVSKNRLSSVSFSPLGFVTFTCFGALFYDGPYKNCYFLIVLVRIFLCPGSCTNDGRFSLVTRRNSASCEPVPKPSAMTLSRC